MRRLSFLGFFLIFVVIIFGVYRVANQYQVNEKQVNILNAKMEDEHENIRVLQAEWAFLTSPVRLEKLARENFQLQPVDGRQMVAANDIPVRAALDAQEVQTNVVDNAPPAVENKIIAATKPQALPNGVVAARVEETTTIATALPMAASHALPPLEATSVSQQVGQ